MWHVIINIYGHVYIYILCLVFTMNSKVGMIIPQLCRLERKVSHRLRGWQSYIIIPILETGKQELNFRNVEVCVAKSNSQKDADPEVKLSMRSSHHDKVLSRIFCIV